MNSVACIIQARRQSTRLPDKILLPLGDKPVLQHVIERCKMIANISEVIIASPDDSFEDPVEQLAAKIGALIYRGSMDDVLSRYWGAAQLTEAPYIMRVTADCPLIDPQVCQALIEKTLENGADYGGLSGWPHGLDCEIFTREQLNQANRAATSPVDREHVTLWMKKQKNLKTVSLSAPSKNLFANNRWVVDYPEDYAFMQELFKFLPQNKTSLWRDVLSVVDAHPELRCINEKRGDEWAKKNETIYKESGQRWRQPS